jgi:hypothetical protein
MPAGNTWSACLDRANSTREPGHQLAGKIGKSPLLKC